MASARQIHVGGVPIGGGAPVAVQTMTKTETANLAATMDQIRKVAEAGVEAGNARLARVEQVKKFTIIPGDWAPGGDELTPTMKLKRRPIAEKYADEIEAMYRK